jgi:hypothetical protein
MAYTAKGGTTATKEIKETTNNNEMEAFKLQLAELKAQNELLMKMLMEKNGQTIQAASTSALNSEYKLIHLVERAPGLTTHIELSNTTIDMSSFGEERTLDRRQCEELAGKYRGLFEKGIIAFGADGDDLSAKFGLKNINDYSYLNKDFVKQLGGLSYTELENLWNKLCEGHRKFVIEYFKRGVLNKDPALSDIHKIELLNRLSNGAMSGTTLDLERERERKAATEAAKN